MSKNTTALCLALVCAVSASLVQAANLYRYKNSEGNTVMDDNIPPESVKNGYEVLNKDGVVIRVVPPQVTAEQQAAVANEMRAQEEAERLRKWDESLLRRYSSVEDIEAARERALGDLRIRVSILKSNKRSLRQQVENYQSQAAEAQRRGQSVSEEHLKAISDLQSEIGITDNAIADREVEIEAVEATYAADIERFGELEDMVEFRRQMANRSSAKSGSGSQIDPRR
ncbi:hypothetical protein [Haliea sp. E17]|uniref:hypothetical protein n=1 Tax=Haliea sp. E17 TaxID=3401576 RepID=UPI003AB0EA8C